MSLITLATLAQHTAQEVFDQAVKHLLTQAKPSLTFSCNKNRCVYLNENGLKCVAGCFIADDEYKPEFESKSWLSLAEDQAVPEAHKALIYDLQTMVHDKPFVPAKNRHTVREWPLFLTEVAQKHDLSADKVYAMYPDFYVALSIK